MSCEMCTNCSKREVCEKPCEALEAHLSKMSRGFLMYHEKLKQRQFKYILTVQKQARILLDNLHLMSPIEQSVVHLRYVHGCSIPDIAFVEGRSKPSIKSILTRVRKKYG